MTIAALSYRDAVELLTARGRFGIKLGLERTRALLDAVGAPDTGLRGALVAGTNGKGSTCAFLVSILTAAGYRVGSMPKPHLSTYTERVCIDGHPIAEADFAALVAELMPAVDAIATEHGPATEFEMLTAAALLHMRRSEVDYLVCEVGMGGALDATNVLDLGVKVITTVELDHMQYLGPDVAAIAAQKAGIIRPGDVVVTGRLRPEADAVVREAAATAGAEVWGLGQEIEMSATDLGWEGSTFDLRVPLAPAGMDRVATRMLGPHQADNAATAVAAAWAMWHRLQTRVGRGHMRRGVLRARWPGRLELVRRGGRVLVDSGHNPAAVAGVVAAVAALVEDGPPPVVLFGAMTDKDIDGMLRGIPGDWPVVFTAVAEDRAESPAALLAAAAAAGREGDTAVDGVPAALAAARAAAGREGLVLVLGSLYLAGAVREELGLA
ncbi:MAG: dihydrofolate synthase / folylpolyglutamate synthase [Chloroflexota bacterium]|nr:dihydrofolate synthase / folylpolyglutamate synthase [Chloroflexota bacterium]